MGRWDAHDHAAFAQPERDTMIERTRAGLAAAAANGRMGGRPRKVDDAGAAKARVFDQARWASDAPGFGAPGRRRPHPVPRPGDAPHLNPDPLRRQRISRAVGMRTHLIRPGENGLARRARQVRHAVSACRAAGPRRREALRCCKN
jgi:hypothetical protein